MVASDSFFRSIQLGRVTLRVRDLDRSLAFYEGLLEFRTIEAHDGLVTLAAASGAPPLLALESSPNAPPRQPGESGLFHVALLYPNRGSLGRMLLRLMRSEVRLGSADHGVSEALYLTDPEGNGLELYADRPVDRWPDAGADGQVTMFTDALDIQGLAAEGRETSGPLMPADLRVGHVHLAVSSLAHAEAFYVHRLGFAVRQRSYPGALFLARDGYHHHLGANTWRSRSAATPGSLGLVRFGLHVASDRDLAQMIAAAGDRAIGPGPEDGTLVRDFDGIEIELLGAAP
jgi:catechol 2,3-dioxygenase